MALDILGAVVACPAPVFSKSPKSAEGVPEGAPEGAPERALDAMLPAPDPRGFYLFMTLRSKCHSGQTPVMLLYQ